MLLLSIHCPNAVMENKKCTKTHFNNILLDFNNKKLSKSISWLNDYENLILHVTIGFASILLSILTVCAKLGQLPPLQLLFRIYLLI